MRIPHRLLAAIFGFHLVGSVVAATAPAPEVRQALAPTGNLRVAFLSAPLYATKDPATGELKGQAVDLGKDVARRVGVPFQPVLYANPEAILAGAKAAEWDIVLMGISAERAAAIDFSAPYMEVEQGYLVRAGVPIASAADVDKPGVRIGVILKAGADLYHSSTLKNATLVRMNTIGEIDTLLKSGAADVIAVTKAALFNTAARFPGSRVLDGRFLVEPIGIGLPKGRDPAALAYVEGFVREAKADGRVREALERAGLRGVVVAPSK